MTDLPTLKALADPHPGMIRVCPERDAICPHGMDCAFARDRYHCDFAASREALRALIAREEKNG